MSTDEIRARWAGVGPWRFDDDSDVMWIERRGTRKRVCWSVYAAADARRIDAAPADIATLLAALDAATAERDAALARVEPDAPPTIGTCKDCAEWRYTCGPPDEARGRCGALAAVLQQKLPNYGIETPHEYFCAWWKARDEKKNE